MFSKKKKRSNGGFTLIELVIVIAIISILTSLAVPKASKYIDKANRSKVIAAISELNNATISFSIDNNGLEPENIEVIIKEYEKENSKLGFSKIEGTNFVVGNIKGVLILENGLVYAKIDENSKAYPGEIINVR